MKRFCFTLFTWEKYNNPTNLDTKLRKGNVPDTVKAKRKAGTGTGEAKIHSGVQSEIGVRSAARRTGIGRDSIGAEHQINPNQLRAWKAAFLEKAPRLFEENKAMKEAARREQESSEEKAVMLKAIGQLTLESDFLMKQAHERNKGVFLRRSCELLGAARSSVYDKAKVPSAEEIAHEENIKKRLDSWHTQSPCSGVRKLRGLLREHEKLTAGRKRIKRYMDEMGIYAIYLKPNFSRVYKTLKEAYQGKSRRLKEAPIILGER
ncbi:MAG: hypothetical protein LBT32_02120 [Peptococcaceae bacterium]|nr:hypothetical protein [Peptococcaceae bacterium]